MHKNGGQSAFGEDSASKTHIGYPVAGWARQDTLIAECFKSKRSSDYKEQVAKEALHDVVRGPGHGTL